MKSKLIIFILFFNFLNTKIKGQSLNSILDTEYHFTERYNDSMPTKKCNETSFACRDFRGSLVPGIGYLWRKDTSFVRVKGVVPFGRIYYYIMALQCEDRDELVEFLQKKMQNMFHFKTEIQKDSAEVLALQVVNPKKLKSYECSQIYGVSGTASYNKDSSLFQVNNMSMVLLTHKIKNNFSTKIYLDVNEKLGYCYNIPSYILKTTSLSVINKYLIENLGLELKKEKRLEEFLIIDFLRQ